MKRIIAAILAGLLMLSLVACAAETETSEPENSSVSSPTESSKQVEESSATESFSTQEPTAEVKVGETILMGTYEQDNDLENGEEPIEWIVVEKSDTGYLVMSLYVLDFGKFHNAEEDVTWETSDIRAWLNGEFYENCFTDEEKAGILLTTVDNSEDSNADLIDFTSSYAKEKGYKQGNDTEDYIFLLSEFEICEKYTLSREHPVGKALFEEAYATSYAFAECTKLGHGLDIDRQMNEYNGKCSCLTRSLTDNDTCIANDRETEINKVYVLARGSCLYCYEYWTEPFGIRPVMWISK